MVYYAEPKKKSVGKNKKTSTSKTKVQVNPIIALLSVLISKKYIDYGRCPVYITEEYAEKIINFLKNKGYDDEQITELLNSNKKLVANCKTAYRTEKCKKYTDYVINPMVDVDACFEIIIQSMPNDFIDATVSLEALGDVLGTLVNKKKDDVWDYVAGVQKQGVQKTK